MAYNNITQSLPGKQRLAAYDRGLKYVNNVWHMPLADTSGKRNMRIKKESRLMTF